MPTYCLDEQCSLIAVSWHFTSKKQTDTSLVHSRLRDSRWKGRQIIRESIQRSLLVFVFARERDRQKRFFSNRELIVCALNSPGLWQGVVSWGNAATRRQTRPSGAPAADCRLPRSAVNYEPAPSFRLFSLSNFSPETLTAAPLTFQTPPSSLK